MIGIQEEHNCTGVTVVFIHVLAIYHTISCGQNHGELLRLEPAASAAATLPLATSFLFYLIVVWALYFGMIGKTTHFSP